MGQGTESTASSSSGKYSRNTTAGFKSFPEESVSSTSSSTSGKARFCPVCYRISCALPSHRRYARDHGGAKRVSFAPVQAALLARARQRRGNANIAGPIAQIDDAVTDPFGNFPIKMTSQLDHIYRYFYLPWTPNFNGPQRHLFPVSRFRLGMEGAQHDAACFLALLAITATQIDLLRRGSVSRLGLQLQNKAIELQIKFCQGGDASDARILSALCIMSNHMANKNPQAVNEHTDAIRRFLDKRGGIGHLGMGGMLADNIMYGDHTRAVVYDQSPSFVIPLPALVPPPTLVRRLGSGFPSLVSVNLVSFHVAEATENMATLIDIYNKACNNETTKAETSYFSYLANVVEYQLAQLNALHHSPGHRLLGVLDDCLTQAMLLIDHTILRNYGQLNPMMPRIESRFWSSFDIVEGTHVPQDFLLWAIFTGIATSTRKPCAFMERGGSSLRKLVCEGVAVTFLEACQILQRYVWCEAVQRQAFAAFWDEYIGFAEQ